MPSRYLLLLLVILMTQHWDMGVSRSIHRCHWHDIKNLTQTFYHQALKIYNSTNTQNSSVLDGVPRIQCHDHCGPEHLVKDSATCLMRVFHVLSYYKKALSILDTSSQNQDFTKISDIISSILHHLQTCGYKDNKPLALQTDVTPEFVRNKIGSPLLSVSILIARVFSPGNPAHHPIHPRH